MKPTYRKAIVALAGLAFALGVAAVTPSDSLGVREIAE